MKNSNNSNEEMYLSMGISKTVYDYGCVIEKSLRERFDEVDRNAEYNQLKVVKAMQEGLHPDGINVLQNNGEAAGQTVMHYHMHIIPRYQGDSVRIGWEPMQGLTNQVAEAADKVRKALEAEK